MTDVEQLLSPRYLRAYSSGLVKPSARQMLVASTGVLPPLATHHYSTGGCFILAIALNEVTGHPLGYQVDAGAHPTHAFVVDGDSAIDTFGRRPLARYDPNQIVVNVSRETLEEKLAAGLNGQLILRDIRDETSYAYARRAAEAVALACGLA